MILALYSRTGLPEIMDTAAATLTLLLVMDPLGNIPLFLSALRSVPEPRRRRVVLRECCFALAILAVVFLGGRGFMAVMDLTQEAVRISGGVLLFIIALRMIYPLRDDAAGPPKEEPFIVPLATPYVAGPSVIAVIILMRGDPEKSLAATGFAVFAAWGITTLILLVSPLLARILKQRGLAAVERLMGMLLIVVAVQMFLDGLHLRR